MSIIRGSQLAKFGKNKYPVENQWRITYNCDLRTKQLSIKEYG
jgi:hypothetical protein